MGVDRNPGRAGATPASKVCEESDSPRMTRRRSQIIFAHVSDGICELDKDGRVTFINLAGARILGREVSELIGSPHDAAWTLPAPSGGACAVCSSIREGALVRAARGELRRPDGEVIALEYTSAPLTDEGRTLGAVVIFNDVSARGQREKSLRARENNLHDFTNGIGDVNAESALETRTRELAAANEALEAFTYSISHDLRAPLRHINLATKFFLEDHGRELRPNALDDLEDIRKATRRMEDMVGDLLQLSRVGRRELCRKTIALGALVEEARLDLTGADTDRVEWEIGDLPDVDCDRSLLRHVFLNLLSNAARFTRTTKFAKIEVGILQDTDPPVVFVRDNGVGFDMKFAKDLFRVFRRLHPEGEFEGTGVGLAIVKRIIDRHGGRVWAEASPDNGACFYFTLPSSAGVGSV